MSLRCNVMLVSYFFKKARWTLKEIHQWKKKIGFEIETTETQY